MQVHVAEIVAALRRQGHEVRVAGPGAGDDPASADDAACAAPPGAGGRLAAAVTARLGAWRGRMPAWAGELLELAYNLVAYPRLKAAARAAAPDVVYERYNLFLLAGVWLARRQGVPLLVEVNAPLMHERATHGSLALKPLARWAERYVWRRADWVLPVSHVLAEAVRAAGVPAERIAVIPNGVRAEAHQGRDAARARRRADLDVDAATVVFGFVGFVRPWHGLDRVLESLAPEGNAANGAGGGAHLVVVGDGPARAALESRAQALGVDGRLTVTGAVPHAAVPDWLAAFDVALQPDVTAYASPLKLLEYMAAGLAIVAPNRPNIRELVTDGHSALLFDPEAPGALAAAVARLAGAPGLRARLGAAAAREIDRRGLTWDANAARIAALARTCAAARPGGAASVKPIKGRAVRS